MQGRHTGTRENTSLVTFKGYSNIYTLAGEPLAQRIRDLLTSAVPKMTSQEKPALRIPRTFCSFTRPRSSDMDSESPPSLKVKGDSQHLPVHTYSFDNQALNCVQGGSGYLEPLTCLGQRARSPRPLMSPPRGLTVEPNPAFSAKHHIQISQARC
jgi:hypothetical protein